MEEYKYEIIEGIKNGMLAFLKLNNSFRYSLDDSFKAIIREGVTQGVRQYLKDMNWKPSK